jgi:hypothetical protein
MSGTSDLAYPFEPGDTLSAAALNAAIALGQSNQIRSGAGAPSDATGKDGDMWLNTTTGDLYQRTAGHYAIIANLKGPVGSAGPSGGTGPAGPPGPSSGSVTSIATTGPGISGGPITTSGSLAVQWNAGAVSAIGSGISIAGGTISSTATGGGAPSGPAGGDLAGSYPNPTLGTTGVSAGTYGSATQVPVVTVNAKGLVTTMGLATLTAPPVTFASVTGTATYAQLPSEVQIIPISFPFSGKPATGAIVNVPVSMALTIPASLAGATVYDSTKTTSSAVFTVNKIAGGVTTTALGTVTVTSSTNTSATLAGAGGSLAVGDTLQIIAPTQDATLSDIGITILASRV